MHVYVYSYMISCECAHAVCMHACLETAPRAAELMLTTSTMRLLQSLQPAREYADLSIMRMHDLHRSWSPMMPIGEAVPSFCHGFEMTPPSCSCQHRRVCHSLAALPTAPSINSLLFLTPR